MLIDIPEQVNCGHCRFLEEGSYWCLLNTTLNSKGNWSVANWSSKGWRIEKDKECRPDWCPFKATAELYKKIIEESIKTPT